MSSKAEPGVPLPPAHRPLREIASKRKKWPWVVGAIAALLLIGTIDPGASRDKAAAADEGTASIAPTTSAYAPDDRWTTALVQLDSLPIKGRAPKTAYNRQAFGSAWTDDVTVDFGHNGCDTRNDILRRDLTDTTVKPTGCVVLSGVLNDPYTGMAIPFQRGANTSTAVQIDHVVALEDAWQKGAQQLDQQTRQNFANDPRNLQATDGPTNEKKGSGDAATWLPPNKPYRCTYVSRQVAVKSIYGVWVTQAEHDAIANLLTGCGAMAPSSAPILATTEDSAPALAPAPVAPAGPALVEPAPPPPSPAPTPGPGSTSSGVVHPGAFCTGPGGRGVSSRGMSMVCSLAKDGRYRWTAE